MHDERTALLRLPLPHPDNALDEDVERLRAALTALDTESGDVRALLNALSGLLESAAETATWAGVSGKPAAFPPAGHKASHVTGGADALTPADIGAQPAGDYQPAGNYQPAGEYALASDSRLTDARTPTAHAASHNADGSDALTSFSGELRDVAERHQSLGSISGTVTVDLTLGNSISATIGAATTLTFTGAASGACRTLLLTLTNGGKYTVTWPSAIRWPGGTAPTLTKSGVDLVILATSDGGTTWRGVATTGYAG